MFNKKCIYLQQQTSYLFNMLSRIIKQFNIIHHNLKPNFTLDKMTVFTQRQTLIWSFLQHLKNKSVDQIVLKYKNNRVTQGDGKSQYFQILVELINYFEENSWQSIMLKDILQKLLQIQHNEHKYLKIIPKQMFLAIKKYNHKTYQRKEKKIHSKTDLAYYCNSAFEDSSKGFAEITLQLCNYFTDPRINITSVWQKLLGIVGKYELSFNKIIQIVIDLVPTVLYQKKIHEIIKMIDARYLSHLLLSKMFPNGKQEASIIFCGNISFLLQKHTGCGFLDFGQKTDQKYLRIFKICIENGIFSQEQFKDHLPSIGNLHLIQRQKRILCTTHQRLQKFQNKVLDQVSLSEIEEYQRNKNQLLMGQVVGCYMFNKLQEKLKNNQFLQFKRLYDKLCDQKVTITISAPLIKIFCDLIEWMINPFLQSYSVNKHFIKHIISSKLPFRQGYFSQSSDLTLDLIKQLQEIFYYLDIYIGFSAFTFQKLVNAFILFLTYKTRLDLEHHQEIKHRIRNIIQKYLLAAISLQTNNPTVSLRLSQILQLFSQKQRFEMYQYYVQHIMFENLHLVYPLQQVSKFQGSFLNKVKFDSKHQDLFPLCNLQLNFPFQSSYELSKRLTTSFFGNFIPIITQVMLYSPFLSKDILIYFCLNTLMRNQQKLLTDYDKPTQYYKSIIFFLCELYKKDKKIQMDILFQLALVRLKEYIEEPPATQMVVPAYNKNLVFLKLLSAIMEEICPVLSELITSTSDKYEYLLQGYCMKLYLSDKCLQYGRNTILRQNFYLALFKKQPNNQSYFLSLISLVNYHLRFFSTYHKNHQQNASKTILKHGKNIDECKSFLSHLFTFFCLQMNRKDLYSIEKNSLPFDFEDIVDLMIKQQLEFGFGCWLLRQTHRYEFQQGRHTDIKRKWIRLLNKKYQAIENQQFQTIMISKEKVLSFVKSDFFFNFWFSSTQHIVSYQDKYCHKITQLRRKLQAKEVESTDKQKLVLACNLIQGQKQQYRKSYQAFNVLSFSLQNLELGHRNPRYELPLEYQYYKQKTKIQSSKSNQQQLFKEFINLYFTYCLLPRILIDPCQAIFCSKFTFRLIKENKLPSNKSLMIIFTIVEAAVGYVQFSTQKEASKCLPIFINDLLKLLKNWNDSSQFQANLLTQIGMEKFTDKRYQILKEFILDFTTKVTNKLTIIKDQLFINRNIMLFLGKVDYIPLTQEQGQDILVFVKEILSTNMTLKTICQRIITILQKRIKNVASIKNVLINRQTKSHAEKARKAAQIIPLPDLSKKISKKEITQSKSQPKVQKKVIVIDLDDDQEAINIKPAPMKAQIKGQMVFCDQDD